MEEQKNDLILVDTDEETAVIFYWLNKGLAIIASVLALILIILLFLVKCLAN